MNYYNDNDRFVAQWLRNLVAAGQIPDGVVDDRPIQEVQPGGKLAVAQMRRGRKLVSWWFYCREHLYGRRIENGEVLVEVYVPGVTGMAGPKRLESVGE